MKKMINLSDGNQNHKLNLVNCPICNGNKCPECHNQGKVTKGKAMNMNKV